MRILLLLIILPWLVMTVAAKDVYRYIDEQGNVVYSDTPAPGAEVIKIDDMQTIEPGEIPKFTYTPPAEDVPAYTQLEIISPENDSVIRNLEGNVTINVLLESGLNVREGHYLLLYLDGNKIASATSPQFNLGGVEQGYHSANVVVVDKEESEIIRSPSVSFTLQKESLIEPSSKERQMPTAKEAADPEVIKKEGTRGFTPRKMPTAKEVADPAWIKKHGVHGFAPRQTPPAPPPGPKETKSPPPP